MNASATTSPPPAAAGAQAAILRGALGLFAFYYVGLSIWMAVSPHTFYTALGPFEAQNDHYLRDTATFELAIGVGLWIAVNRVSWRVPMLAVSTLQFAAHSINHLVDIDSAHPNWIGYFDFFALFVTTLQLGWLLLAARRAHPEPAPGKGA